MIGADGLLEQFVHVGLSESEAAAIGDLPKGLGLLGALIKDPQPIRLAKLSTDGRSSGFPAPHPPMESFLGVPIRVKGELFGSLYLTEHSRGEFAAHDEDLLLAFSTTAGTAIANAQLYEESRQRQQWLQSSAEIIALILSPDKQVDPLRLIVERVGRLADADTAMLVLPMPDTDLLRMAVVVGHAASELVDQTYPAAGSLVGLAMSTGQGVHADAPSELSRNSLSVQEVLDVGAAMAVPWIGGTGAVGALGLTRRRGRRPFTTADLEMAHVFANHAGIAMDLEVARTDQQRLAILEDRDRIAYDLHDHVIQRLFATGLSVQSMASVKPGTDLGPRFARIVTDIDDTIRQLRSSIFELQRTETTSAGVRTSVLKVVHQTAPMLGFEPSIRFVGPCDTAVSEALIPVVEAVVREAITNAAKHAQATELQIAITAAAGMLTVEITDNGIGLGSASRRSGLSNLKRRAQKLGGTLTIDQHQEIGSQIRWAIPLR